MSEFGIENLTDFSDKLSKTINKLMQLHRINMHQLHKNTGVPLTTINRLVNDKKINPTINSLLPIADYFGITLNQLMGIDPLNSELLVGKYSSKRELWTQVPIINWEQVIDWPKVTFQHVISTDLVLNKNPFALVVQEVNWEGFFPNSVLIVDQVNMPEHRDYAVVLKNGQKRASLKQILMDDDKIYLRPLNKDYQTQIMDNSFRIIGVVMQIRIDRKIY